MADGWAVATGIFGVVGSLGGVIGTVSAIRASSARRYAERGADAAALLIAVSQADRFVSEGSNIRLTNELSRVIRESAAVYAKQYPTPAGNDGLRMLSAVYAALFAGFAPVLIVTGLLESTASRRTAGLIVGGICVLLAMLCATVALTLLDRVKRRNEARELSETPGREHYFESVHAAITIWRHRRAMKSQSVGRPHRRS